MSFRICFVCLGNICRSPIAATVMRSLLAENGLADEVDVSSAGTGDWHIGERADERALAALTRHGYDGSEHRARQFVSEAIADNDLVIAMDSSNMSALRRMAAGDELHKLRLLRDFDPDATGSDVPDPYYGGEEGFDEVLSMVEAACRGLVDQLRVELAG